MEITLRVAMMDDVPTLKKLIPQSVRELSKGYYTPQQIESAITYIFGVDTQLISDRCKGVGGGSPAPQVKFYKKISAGLPPN